MRQHNQATVVTAQGRNSQQAEFPALPLSPALGPCYAYWVTVCQSLSIYHLSMLPMKQSPLHELSRLMLTTAPRGSYFDYLHSVEKKRFREFRNDIMQWQNRDLSLISESVLLTTILFCVSGVTLTRLAKCLAHSRCITNICFSYNWRFQTPYT